jgi:hypothetical protein
MNIWLIFMFIYTVYTVNVGWDSVVNIAWMVQGLNAGGSEIFCTHPDQTWCPSSLLYNGYWGSPMGGTAARAWH